jgi:hypothetical protein
MTRWELKNGVSYIQRDVVWDNASRVTNLKDLLTAAQASRQGSQASRQGSGLSLSHLMLLSSNHG